jgi:hypothetical protein
VRFTRQAQAAAAPTDRRQAVADDAGVSVLLVGGAPLTGKVFTLPDPPRRRPPGWSAA